MFKRLNSADDCPGCGMGLPVCRQIVKKHNGTLEVESSGHEGSRFSFTFPTET